MSEKFSAEDDEVLIDLIRQHPTLYTVSGKSYKDLVVKNNIWKKLGEVMGKSEKACQVRWKNIRDYYQKKKREAKKGMTTGSASSSGDSFGNKFKHLSFLENTSFVERKSTCSISEDSQRSYQETEQVQSESYNGIEESQVPGGSQLASSQIVSADEAVEDTERTEKNVTTPPQRKKPRISQERTIILQEFKKGRDERTKLMKDLLQTDNSKKSESAISMFFSSIAATVEQFPPALQTRAKVDVMNVISRLEFENHGINIRHDIDVRASTSNSLYSDSSLHFDQETNSTAGSYLSSFTTENNLLSPDTPITQFE